MLESSGPDGSTNIHTSRFTSLNATATWNHGRPEVTEDQRRLVRFKE